MRHSQHCLMDVSYATKVLQLGRSIQLDIQFINILQGTRYRCLEVCQIKQYSLFMDVVRAIRP